MASETGAGGTALKQKDPYASLAEFCSVMENSNIAMYVIDPDTFEILYGNKALCSRYDARILGAKCHRLLQGSEDPCPTCPVVRLYREGVNAPVESYNPVLGAWILVNVAPLHWQGRELAQVTCTNITKQKRLESELRLFNKEYEALLHHSVLGIMRYDIVKDTAVLKFSDDPDNSRTQFIPNYSQVYLQANIILPSSHEEARKGFEMIRQGIPCKEGYDLEFTIDGKRRRWCHVEYMTICDDQGRPSRAVISLADVTQRKKREQEYKDWNARFSAIVGKYTAFMEFNLTRDAIEAKGTYGMEKQVTPGLRYSEYIEEKAANHIHPEDVRAYRSFFDRERLLGRFYAGYMSDSLTYRIMSGGVPKWYAAEVHMTSEPTDSEIKAFVLVNNVDADIQERERLLKEAERDAMTGLYNHAMTERLIKQLLARDTGEQCCFLVIDLDDLRNINNKLGHPEGDRAIRAIAKSMLDHFDRHSILGRVGGDEFVALLRDAPDREELERFMDAFRQRLREIGIGPLNDRPVQVSIGGALGVVGRDDFKTLYERADLALYYTKAMGKNAFHLYTPQMEKRDFKYQPVSAVALAKARAFDDTELDKLMKALSGFFPLIISANLTRNTYYMMEYMNYANQSAKDEGDFEALIYESSFTFHPEDRQGFRDTLGREGLLNAYAEGRTRVEHTGRQLGDNGVYHIAHTVAVFVPDPKTGDICEISFTNIL